MHGYVYIYVYSFFPKQFTVVPQTIYCWGSILETKELATLTGRAPELCGWALCPGLVLLLSSVTGLCGWVLFSSCFFLVLLLSLSFLCP